MQTSESMIAFKAEDINNVGELSVILEKVAPEFNQIPGMKQTFTDAAGNLRVLAESSSFNEIISSLTLLNPLFRAIENNVVQSPINASNKSQFQALKNTLGELIRIIPNIQPNLVTFMPGNISTILSWLLVIEFIKNKTERAFSSVVSLASGIICFVDWKISYQENPEHIDLIKLVKSIKKAMDIKEPLPANQTLMPLAFLSRTIFRAIVMIEATPELKGNHAIVAQINDAWKEAQTAHQKIMDRKLQLENDRNNVVFYDYVSTPILSNQIHFCTQCEFEFESSSNHLKEKGILINQSAQSPQTSLFLLSQDTQNFMPPTARPPTPTSPSKTAASFSNNQ